VASNADRLREMYERFWVQKDWNAGRDVMSDDVEWLGMDDVLGRARRGPAQIRDFFREWLEAWDEVSNDYELEEIDDDLILVVSHFRGTGRASGIEAVMDLWQIYEFEDGLITRQTMYRSAEEAQRAVDLLRTLD
jgi:ketosteroid isomerase-like protein